MSSDIHLNGMFSDKEFLSRHVIRDKGAWEKCYQCSGYQEQTKSDEMIMVKETIMAVAKMKIAVLTIIMMIVMVTRTDDSDIYNNDNVTNTFSDTITINLFFL